MKIGKSKSALQLSAMDDIKKILDKYEEKIYGSIVEYLCNINIEEELDEIFLETGEEDIYWNINSISIEKEQKNIKYYVELDICVLADLIYREDGGYPSDAGKVALSLTGQMVIELEEYSTVNKLENLISKRMIFYI